MSHWAGKPEGWPYLPTMELVFTMEPPSPCSIMMRAAAWVHTNTAVTLMDMTLLNSSKV